MFLKYFRKKNSMLMKEQRRFTSFIGTKFLKQTIQTMYKGRIELLRSSEGLQLLFSL